MMFVVWWNKYNMKAVLFFYKVIWENYKII